MDISTTYRVIDLADRDNVGQAALTPELAKLACARMSRTGSSRYVLEATDWWDDNGVPKARRSVITEAEEAANLWGAKP